MTKYKYGKGSLNKLKTVHPLLSQVFINVLAMGLVDVSIVFGVRGKEEQNRLFKEGKSKLQWPESKHNIQRLGDKALAIDAAPYIQGKISNDFNHHSFLAGLVLSEGYKMGINIRWGGNWDQDGEIITDQTFNDLYHYELII